MHVSQRTISESMASETRKQHFLYSSLTEMVASIRSLNCVFKFASRHQICDPPPRNESQCAKPTFAVARNLLQGCGNVDFEILVVTA